MLLLYSIFTDPLTGLWLLEFRRSEASDVPARKGLDLPDFERTVNGVRCPICKWRPDRESRWTCLDWDHPEFFYNGCGTDWNTFETGGQCPTCLHQWIWTSCLACWGWSRHEDWYEEEPG